MRLSHLLLAVVSLLPLASQAITLDKLGGRWVNTDVTCKENFREGEYCELIITPKDKNSGTLNIGYKGKKIGNPMHIGVNDANIWTVSADGIAISDLEYEDGMLYDDDDVKYYRVSK